MYVYQYMKRRCFRKCSYVCLYIYYKQNTITNPYRLFQPLEGVTVESSLIRYVVKNSRQHQSK